MVGRAFALGEASGDLGTCDVDEFGYIDRVTTIAGRSTGMPSRCCSSRNELTLTRVSPTGIVWIRSPVRLSQISTKPSKSAVAIIEPSRLTSISRSIPPRLENGSPTYSQVEVSNRADTLRGVGSQEVSAVG